MTEYPSWLTGLLKKRTPDAIKILADLIRIGLRNGEVSAADLPDYRLDQPNITGGCFKILKRFGFTHTDRRAKTTQPRKHQRRVDVYELTDRSKAEAFISYQQQILVPKQQADDPQGRLF